MSIVYDTIVVEDRLETMFEDLPKMKSLSGETYHSVVFGYGDKKELNAFLSNREEPYPLIWLLYPYSENHQKTKVVVDGAVFILAVSTNSSMQNYERLKVTFGKILIPLFNNFRLLFRRSNIVNFEEDFIIQKHPNYSDSEEGEQNAGSFIWDALRVSFDFSLNSSCYKKLKI